MIFEDPSRARWKKTRILFAVTFITGLALLLDVAVSLLTSPSLPKLASLDKAPNVADLVETDMVSPESTAKLNVLVRTGVDRPARDGAAPFTGGFVRTAFMVQDDPRSVASLKGNLAKLDVVFPDYYSVSGASGKLRETINPDVEQTLASAGVWVMPRLANTDERGNWHSDEMSKLLRNPENRAKLVANLTQSLATHHAHGLNLDFESLDKADREEFLDFVGDLSKALHAKGMWLTVDVPSYDEAFDYEALGQLADAVVVMCYDEHFPGGAPGPIASNTWVADAIGDMAKRVPPGKLIAAMGAFGYDWTVGGDQKHEARALSFADAMILADGLGVDVEADKDSLNSTFNYKDSAGLEHQVWFLDAVSAWDQYVIARKAGLRGISMWRLGQEEPTLWAFFCGDANFRPDALATVRTAPSVSVEGAGEMLRVKQIPADGQRTLTFDGESIDYAGYTKLPRYYVVEKFGKADAKKVALTFDDGPDPTWTPRILEVLEENDVTGTFFLVGDQVQRYPSLVKREFDGGHLLGNHTFLHPNIQAISETRLKVELNTTQRLIESITGRQTVLFRPPFDTDSTPTSPEQLAPLYAANQLGYVVAGADVDSDDYDRPGAAAIVQTVMSRLKKTGSNVVVFHDAGGERSQTVEALSTLIPMLRSEGYQIVGLADLIGMDHAELMPPITFGEHAVILGERVMTWGHSVLWPILVVLFAISTAISVARILFLGYLVLRSERKRKPAARGFTPPVAVLVPAYNEEKVIRRTLDGVLRSDYPNLTVLVIDDGSTDATAAVAAQAAREDSRIRVITKLNGGKFSALNLGMQQADEDYVVTIDADTIVLPHTIRELMAPFVDPKVDAVCGNVQVGNVKNLLTAFQDVEYVTSQNYDRRAFESLNCIGVVPGATGAWRRTAVLDIGGYSNQTLTEDADLTLALLRSGGRIVYAPDARSITEAPETVRALFKQRFRWSFGTFQCLWKHRKAFGRGPLGWVALPNMLLFQILFPLLAPIGDLVLLLSLIKGDFGAIAVGYLTFLAMDAAGSAIAFNLEHRSLRHIWTVLIQRFFYRQFMYVVTFKAVLAALRGGRHGWNKLERQGTVNLAPTPAAAKPAPPAAIDQAVLAA